MRLGEGLKVVCEGEANGLGSSREGLSEQVFSCAGQEMAISWSQSGPPGPQGIAGPQGAPGPHVRPGLGESPAHKVPLDRKARRAHPFGPGGVSGYEIVNGLGILERSPET
jgi:hypothetical protein